MSIDVVIEADAWQLAGLEALAQIGAQAALSYFELDFADYEICLLGCNDARIAELNGDFRAKPLPTNVLSWPAVDLRACDDGAAPVLPESGLEKRDVGAEIALGDIAIAYETCTRESQEQGKKFDQHVTHLIVHGVLHLLGFDHIRDKDATLMEAHETAILCKLGQPDPYI